MGKLTEKIALITGAATGLGKDIAIRLAEEGATVILSDINEQLLEETSSQLKKQYSVHYIVADVANQEDVLRMVDEVITKYGRLDIVVNNAGGSLHTPKNLEDITEVDWNKVLDVNLKGTFFVSQAAVKYMKEKSSGKIINMASIGGRTASIVTGVAYAAAKGGVISFTRRLAREVGEYGINVNAVAPGVIISGERIKQLFYEQNTEAERQQTLNDIPLKKLGEVEDISNAVAFLASEDSKYMTGAVLDINGGRFMG